MGTPHDGVADVRQLDRRLGRRGAIARRRVVDRDLRPRRRRVESKSRLGVQPPVGGDAGGKRLVDHAQIDRRSERQGGRVHLHPELCLRRPHRDTLVLARELEIERRRHRAKLRLHARARRRRGAST